MLRKFKIAVDGKEYLVEMEEIGAQNNKPIAEAPQAPQVQVEPKTTVEKEVSKEKSSKVAPKPSDASKAMDAPMPGNVLKVLVNVGDKVISNQPIMILEAMKMENELVASRDGVISEIYVKSGDTVNAGDLLIAID